MSDWQPPAGDKVVNADGPVPTPPVWTPPATDQVVPQIKSVLPQPDNASVATWLGVLEQPGAGLYGIASDAAAGAYSLFKASVAKAAGMNFGDTFREEYHLAKDALPEYVPITPGGKVMTDKLSEILGSAVQSFGDTMYERGGIPRTGNMLFDTAVDIARSAIGAKPSPAAGALGQAAATLAMLRATPAGEKAPSVARPPADPIELFKMKYPRTDAAIEASRVGKIIPRLKSVDPDSPLETAQVKVLDAVDQALNEELGIDPAKASLSDQPQPNIADKLKMVIAKYGTDVPQADQIKVANAYSDKFKRLQDYQDAVIESRPKLPDKSQVITVTPKGTALLSEHMQSIINGEQPKFKTQGGAIDLELLTPSLQNLKKSLGNVKGILKDSTGGIIVFRGQTHTEPHEAAMTGGNYPAVYVTDSPYTANTFTSVSQDALSATSLPPSKVFPFVIRENVVVKEFPGHVDQYGNFSYGEFDAFAASLGPNEVGVVRNSRDSGGGIDPHGLSDAKNDQYAFTDPSVVVPLTDFLGGQHTRWQTDVAMWKGRRSSNTPKKAPQVSDLDFTTKVENAKQFKEPSWKHEIDEDGVHTWYDSKNQLLIAKYGGTGYEVSVADDSGFHILSHEATLEDAQSFATGYAKGGLQSVQVGYKQSGSIDIEGLDKNLPKAKQALAHAWVPQNPDAAAKRGEAALDNNYKAYDEAKKIFSINTLKSIRRGTVQHDYDLQHDLAKAGPLGEQAMLKMNVEHNATMVAKTRYDKAARNIFDDLSGDDVKNVEKIIRARRIIQIDAYKGLNKIKHEGNTNGPEQAAFLAAFEKRLGSEKYQALDKKADAYFAEEKVNLERLRVEGLIDQEMYDKMKNLDYSRTEYLDIIDPEIPITSKVKGIRSIRSSGIPRLGRGKETAANMDARTLLIEDIARVENRISRNNTLKAIYGLAEQNPDNGIVALSKSVNKDGEVKAVPEGWTSIGVRIDGKQHHVIMRNEFAEQFVSRNDASLNTVVFNLGDHQVTLGTLLRTLSGSALLRATATTYNPSFAIAGLPMDILHLWMASKDAYSPHLPVYLAQIGKDLAATAKDAVRHTGAWEQAMQEGMGPSFMTHESRGAITGRQGVLSVMAPHLEKIRKVLSYVGDTQDTWVRLAHRHRLIQQGISSADATAMAVHRLNYYRGGVLTKFIDAIVPYTNITVNATARAIENAAADPKGTVTKIAWITAVAGSAKIASMMMSPETDKQISSQDKVRNFNITFGDQYFVLDPDGNRRYVYVPIRLDQVVMPFNAAVVGGLELAEYGKVPDGVVKEAVGQVNPLSTMFPPILNAYRAYADNYDPYKDSSIYKGPKVNPEDQIRSYARGQATGKVATAVGESTGTSPMGLEAAAGQLINTNNFWLQLMGSTNRFLFGNMDPREQSESTLQLLQGTPLSRIVKLTTPGTQMLKDLDKAEQDFGSKHSKQIRALDELLYQMEHKQGGVTAKSLQAWISAQPVDDQKSLATHAKHSYAVDQVLRKYKVSEGIPPRSWWVASSKIPDEPRAQVFYNQWISADADGRKRMLEIANALHNSGVGYVSPRFQKEFSKERRLLGDDRR